VIDPHSYVSTDRAVTTINFSKFQKDLDDEISELLKCKKELPKLIAKAKRMEETMNKFMWLSQEQADSPKGKALEKKINVMEKEIEDEMRRMRMIPEERHSYSKIDWDGIRIRS